MKKQDYCLSESAKQRAKELLAKRVANKPENFANARDVRNFLEHAIANQASRLVMLNNVEQNKELLATIEAEDFSDFE